MVVFLERLFSFGRTINIFHDLEKYESTSQFQQLNPSLPYKHQDQENSLSFNYFIKYSRKSKYQVISAIGGLKNSHIPYRKFSFLIKSYFWKFGISGIV